jgi:hypothetical protein
MRRATRSTAAALAILAVAVTAGLGPGRHTCDWPTPSPASEPEATVASDEHHHEHGEDLCLACVLLGQFRSIGLPALSQVPPPQYGHVIGTGQHSLPTRLCLRQTRARAPPLASPQSHTV